MKFHRLFYCFNINYYEDYYPLYFLSKCYYY